MVPCFDCGAIGHLMRPNSRITAAGILAIVDHAYWLMRGAFF